MERLTGRLHAGDRGEIESRAADEDQHRSVGVV